MRGVVVHGGVQNAVLSELKFEKPIIPQQSIKHSKSVSLMQPSNNLYLMRSSDIENVSTSQFLRYLKFAKLGK